jgi:hypothetical protein
MLSDTYLIPIILPHLNIGGSKIPFLGHGGFIIVDKQGKATYVDYGLYNENNSTLVATKNPDPTAGNIREQKIEAQIKFDDSGVITQGSLKRALDEVFGNNGPFQGDTGKISGTQFKMSQEQFEKVDVWKDKEIKRVNDGKSQYDLLTHNCIDFLYDAAEAAGLIIDHFDRRVGPEIPSRSAEKILLTAKSGFDYYGPNSWLGSKLVPSTYGVQTVDSVKDQLWQAAKALWHNTEAALTKIGEVERTYAIDLITDLPTSLELRDKRGRLLQRTSLEDGKALKSISLDEVGQKTREALLDPNGSLKSISTFEPATGKHKVTTEFDFAGRKHRETHFEADGSRTEQSFDAPLGKLTLVRQFNGNGTTTGEQHFDKDGNVTYDLIKVEAARKVAEELAKRAAAERQAIEEAAINRASSEKALADRVAAEKLIAEQQAANEAAMRQASAEQAERERLAQENLVAEKRAWVQLLEKQASDRERRASTGGSPIEKMQANAELATIRKALKEGNDAITLLAQQYERKWLAFREAQQGAVEAQQRKQAAENARKQAQEAANDAKNKIDRLKAEKAAGNETAADEAARRAASGRTTFSRSLYRITEYDAGNDKPWARKDDYYDHRDNRIASLQVMDDGTSVVTGYQKRGSDRGDPYGSTTFDKDGKLIGKTGKFGPGYLPGMPFTLPAGAYRSPVITSDDAWLLAPPSPSGFSRIPIALPRKSGGGTLGGIDAPEPPPGTGIDAIAPPHPLGTKRWDPILPPAGWGDNGFPKFSLDLAPFPDESASISPLTPVPIPLVTREKLPPAGSKWAGLTFHAYSPFEPGDVYMVGCLMNNEGRFTELFAIKPSNIPADVPIVYDLDKKPVIFDINRDDHLDLRLLDLLAASAPRFDWNGDGDPDRTAWVGPEDGLLVIDLGQDGAYGADGRINQAREIAFSLWKTEKEIAAENEMPVTDLEGLRYAFDSNHDNILDGNDTSWSEFRVWRDANQNGISEDGELLTMSEAGIKLIQLLPDEEGARQFADGSAITGTSLATLTDGTTMLVGDASLRLQPSASTLHPMG